MNTWKSARKLARRVIKEDVHLYATCHCFWETLPYPTKEGNVWSLFFRVLWQVHKSVETDQANRLLVIQNRLWKQQCIVSTPLSKGLEN